jgi:hypothetical protein
MAKRNAMLKNPLFRHRMSQFPVDFVHCQSHNHHYGLISALWSARSCRKYRSTARAIESAMRFRQRLVFMTDSSALLER